MSSSALHWVFLPPLRLAPAKPQPQIDPRVRRQALVFLHEVGAHDLERCATPCRVPRGVLQGVNRQKLARRRGWHTRGLAHARFLAWLTSCPTGRSEGRRCLRSSGAGPAPAAAAAAARVRRQRQLPARSGRAGSGGAVHRRPVRCGALPPGARGTHGSLVLSDPEHPRQAIRRPAGHRRRSPVPRTGLTDPRGFPWPASGSGATRAS